MASAARLPIVAPRVGACVRTFLFRGIDLNGSTLEMQARLAPDTPGAPLIDLTPQAPGSEGISIGAAIVDGNGVPSTPVTIRISEATMKDPNKVPYMGELGDSGILAYALVGSGGAIGADRRLLVSGDLIAQATAFGSDNAPAGRVASFQRMEAWGGTNTATVEWDAGTTLQVSIDGVDILALQLAQARVAMTAAQVAAADAKATSGALGSRLNAIGLGSSLVTRVHEFVDGLGRVLAFIDSANRFVISRIRAVTAYEVGTGARSIVDNADPRSFERITDQKGNTVLDVRASASRIPAVVTKRIVTDLIGSRPPSALQTFFNGAAVQRSDIGLLVSSTFGQSLSIGTSGADNAADSAILTPVDHYHNLMFKGGIRYPIDGGGDVSALVPFAETAPPGGRGGETIHGGYNAMIAQLFAACGITPTDNPMSTISMAPGQGSPPIDDFLEGGGLFARFLTGIQAAHDLAGGRKVVVAPVKWMQVETQGPGEANYVQQLIGLATSIDTHVRVITGQVEPCGLLTYQQRMRDSSYKFSTAARLSPLIQIAGPIWDLRVDGPSTGSSGTQYDFVHLSSQGYYMYGARCAVADFSSIYLKRPWRPLQISRDARGRVRCRVVGTDLYIRYDVPFDGELFMDQFNPNITASQGIPQGAIIQNGFWMLDANGNNIPLKDVAVAGRNEIIIPGCAPQPGYTLNVGSPLLTRTYAAAASCLRDRMGDVLTIDDFGQAPLHNPAIGEGWTMTAEELAM